MRDDHAFVHRLRPGIDDILSDASGRPAYGIDIHAVRSGADNAAKSRGTKVHVLEEMLAHLVFIFLQLQKLCVKRVRFRHIRKPQIETIFMIHQNNTSLSQIVPAALRDCQYLKMAGRSANL